MSKSKKRLILAGLLCLVVAKAEIDFAIRTSSTTNRYKGEVKRPAITSPYLNYLNNNDYTVTNINDKIYRNPSQTFSDDINQEQVFDYETEIALLEIYVQRIPNKSLRDHCYIYMKKLYEYLEAVREKDEVKMEMILNAINNEKEALPSFYTLMLKEEKEDFFTFWVNYNGALWDIYDAYSKDIKNFNLKISF